ncbi:MAG: hypothetical protein KAI83_15010 [Thiomargarita sp.]|nr:hypothetical protein [Thiomargarita sp.]
MPTILPSISVGNHVAHPTNFSCPPSCLNAIKLRADTQVSPGVMKMSQTELPSVIPFLFHSFFLF